MDQTFDLPPGAIKWTIGSPEGRLKAPPGFVMIDQVTGTLYIKQSLPELDTGWAAITGSVSGGNAVIFKGSGDPNGVQTGSVSNFYLDTTAGQLWVKTTGNNTNTGWTI